MNRKEAMRQNHQEDTLRSLGFTTDEARQLRRISMTLRRWYELECGVEGGGIERDEKTGKPHWSFQVPGSSNARSVYPIPDRETGAIKRLKKIVQSRNSRSKTGHFDEPITPYIQTDPRGAALYILRPGDVPAGEDASAYYSRGICVY